MERAADGDSLGGEPWIGGLDRLNVGRVEHCQPGGEHRHVRVRWDVFPGIDNDGRGEL